MKNKDFYMCPYDENFNCKRPPGVYCEKCPIRRDPGRITKSELAEAINKSLFEKHDRDLMRGDE